MTSEEWYERHYGVRSDGPLLVEPPGTFRQQVIGAREAGLAEAAERIAELERTLVYRDNELGRLRRAVHEHMGSTLRLPREALAQTARELKDALEGTAG